ncbi:DUF2490 domain-containing protein [Dyadobacter sp.]|uniref:DUF2490 domain-containing protein n=1 Tax=Dyadobacter sp. TaxID=1914288 RepID=UPI003F70AE9C
MMVDPFRIFMAACVLVCIHFHVLAQNANSGWNFLSHTQQLSKKWDLLFDAQVRTGDQFKAVNTLLLRAAAGYRVNDQNAFALGYASKNDWERENNEVQFQPEHRIYQQYQLSTQLGQTEWTFRGRFEQRFVKTERVLFSQRARAFTAFQIPIFVQGDFKKGLYLNFQDEIFLNVSHQSHVNNSFFDQNRVLGSVGYRWSEKIDTELGYMYWYQREADGDVATHVIQLMITTSF